ncbi:hypothetical protein RA276_32380, partial [Pseudomonas syringae pv. tagetis]
QELIFLRETVGEYAPDDPTAPPELVLIGTGFREENESKYVDATLIIRGDVKHLVSPEQLHAKDIPLPNSNDGSEFHG